MLPIFSLKPSTPITGLPFHVHDRYDPKVIRLFQINNGVGKIAAEMSPCGWLEFPKALRRSTNLTKQSFHLSLTSHSKLGGNAGIITNGSGKFFVSLRVKQKFHRPAILRARMSDSSSGIPFTFPDSISAMRRSISVFQD